MKYTNYILTLAAAAFLTTSCSDNDIAESVSPSEQGGKEGYKIGFDIDLTQDWYAERPETKAMQKENRMRVHQVQAPDGSQAILTSHTLAGINIRRTQELATTELAAGDLSSLQPDAAPRRARAITQASEMSDFGSFCYRADGTEYYKNVKANNQGVLSEDYIWEPKDEFYFYAVPPYDASKVEVDAASLTYTWDTYSNVPNSSQKDLMYATTGVQKYRWTGIVPLEFNHALTAVKFQLGDRVGFGAAKIKYIYLRGVYTSGKLNVTKDGTATWDDLSYVYNSIGYNYSYVSLDADATKPNTAITNDNETFLMIPQKFDENHKLTIEITFDDNTRISKVLDNEEFVMGTTKVYTLSKTGNEYTLNLYSNGTRYPSGFGTGNNALSCTDESTSDYTLLSYRTQEDGTQVNVPYTVTYEESLDNGETWQAPTTTKPSWLKTQHLGESGEGSVSGLRGNATVGVELGVDIIDRNAERNEQLKNADAKSNYDLSQGGETANCYIISAPGTYKIPLIYGNMRKSDGTINLDAVGGDDATKNVTFVDAANTNLFTQGEMYIQGISDATPALAWTDITSDIVTNLSIDQSNKFLTFEVTKEAIQQGNAVVGIKNDDGYLWSWNLWFAPEDAMSVVSFTNAAGEVIGFSNENLGLAYDQWVETCYDHNRIVRMTVTQTEAKAGEEPLSASLTITQISGIQLRAHNNLYQFGRKDALPGIGRDKAGVYITNAGTREDNRTDFTKPIKQPDKFLPASWGLLYPNYVNFWSAKYDGSDGVHKTADVVKTVYDPCPAGFKTPGEDAFSGFNNEDIVYYPLNGFAI